MNRSIWILLFLQTFSYLAVHGLSCSGNPCQLGDYYEQERGYQCIQLNSDALCTCPNGGYEIDRPCRVCDRSNPANNPCIPSANLLACLETDDFGTPFACLCQGPSGPFPTASASCDPTNPLTTTSTISTNTGSVVSSSPILCWNGGNFVDNGCQCPSGFGGSLCQEKNESRLCDNIVCKNAGVCVIRNTNGPYVSVCLCRFATSGDYCELNGTSGFCYSGLCLNDASCQENAVGSTRHAYCQCAPGFSGTRCDTRYFQCSTEGNFPDRFLNEQGKYFQCRRVNGVFRLEQKSCPKGLRFNLNRNTCTYPSTP